MDQVRTCSCEFVVNLPGRSKETATSAGCKAASKQTNDVGYCVGMEGLDDLSVFLDLLTICRLTAYLVGTVLQISLVAIFHDMH
jgi:hypothetical protein